MMDAQQQQSQCQGQLEHQQVASDEQLAGQSEARRLSGSSADSSPAHNDTVMDADLRRAHRVNVEMLMLQNAANNMMGAMSQRVPGGAHWLARSARSKSLTGSAAGSAFPASGVLLAASELRAQQHQFAASEQLVALQRQLSTGRKSRTSTSDQDSGIGAPDSRKSSLQVSGPQAVGCAPCVHLRVRTIHSQPEARAADQEAAGSRRSKILDTLASIGRSASRGLDPDSAAQQHRAGSATEYEICLLEARNLTRWTQDMAANGHPATATGGPQRTGSQRGRRDSLLGALVAAATTSGSPGHTGHGQSRRSSADTIFVRVFKHQLADQTVAGADQQADSLSLHSLASLASMSSPTPDYMQLAPVKVPVVEAAGEPTTLNFGELAPTPDAYTFVARAAEFPVRISVYMANKRNGARFTLGHFFVAPDDWQQQHQHQPNRRAGSTDNGGEPCRHTSESSGSATSDYSGERQQPANSRYRILPTTDDDSVDVHIEYKLHETILEATKW